MAMASLNSNHLQMLGEKEKSPFISIGEAMAGECTENSIATTSFISNWWNDLHACSLSSWSTSNSPWQSEPNNNSESSGEENVSIATSSNHSDLSAESVRSLVERGTGNEYAGETVGSDNHLWNHLFLSLGCRGQLCNQDIGENLLDAKNISDRIFYPTCDYSKKIDDSWGLSSLTSLNGVKKELNVLGDSSTEIQRRPKLSDVVGNFPLPYQDATINNDFHFQPRDSALHSIIKDPCSVRNFRSISCFGHDMKLAEEHCGIDASCTMFGRSSQSNGIEYPRALTNSGLADRGRYSYGFPNKPCTNSRSFTDLVAPPRYLNRPLLDINLSKPFLTNLDLSGCRKQAFQTSSFPSPKSICDTPTKRSGRTQGSEGRKRSSDENSERVSKKPKRETSAVSSTKVPKVKHGDKITALQQIVSPFGKTDTASVLWEAIGYIRFLQEQIQLLSTPYMKGNASKDLWGGLERKDRGEGKLDLKSRGLCLVPISCTPQVYPENSGSDYLAPVYRGYLYR